MSKSIGCVKFSSGDIRWFSVNNGTDVGISKLYQHYSDIENELYKVDKVERCSCDSLKDVEFYTTYANGYYRNGRACLICGFITYDDESEIAPTDKFAEEQVEIHQKSHMIGNLHEK